MECLKLGGTQGKWVSKPFCKYFKSLSDCLLSAVGRENCLTKQQTVAVERKPRSVSYPFWLDKMDHHTGRLDLVTCTDVCVHEVFF